MDLYSVLCLSHLGLALLTAKIPVSCSSLAHGKGAVALRAHAAAAAGYVPQQHSCASSRLRPRQVQLVMQLSEDEIKQKLSALRRGGRRLVTSPAVTSPSTAAATPLDGAASSDGATSADVAASSDVAAPPQASAAPAAPAPNIVGGTVLPTDGPAPIERLRTAVASRRAEGELLDEAAAGRVVEFLNAELGDEMLGWLLRWTEVGDKARRRNLWSRGSWTPSTATLTSVSGAALSFRVGVAVRGRKELEHVESELPLPDAVETAAGAG
mmetsp:Transcript_2762/g.8616  ORF Transcript_2762/g.8616 Transcript_2762/m.8616 type:complete len:269 (-) Transcript_2762:611-1417(-)